MTYDKDKLEEVIRDYRYSTSRYGGYNKPKEEFFSLVSNIIWRAINEYDAENKSFDDDKFQDYICDAVDYYLEDTQLGWLVAMTYVEDAYDLRGWVDISDRFVDDIIDIVYTFFQDPFDEDEYEGINESFESQLSKKDDWTGTLVKIQPEWMEPNERDIPYFVVEDRDDRVLVSELRPYAKNAFLGTHCWSKDWCYVIDKDFAGYIE